MLFYGDTAADGLKPSDFVKVPRPPSLAARLPALHAFGALFPSFALLMAPGLVQARAGGPVLPSDCRLQEGLASVLPAASQQARPVGVVPLGSAE